ncbi:hypothetical protein [Bradyrhizobium stylosanthis]|uniref:Uncharacterized protein n=1 Tax=Bradyrhizobium stylosanthis TaxID=1803665 RepID=A0A560D5F7_9BRAD|nr:hypothetical protein [Bradyrhizobium stylosanthis]TWA92328.1 hypothetical protein FBZ96_111121 [Bradyrhizobium stylosanthis]
MTLSSIRPSRACLVAAGLTSFLVAPAQSAPLHPASIATRATASELEQVRFAGGRRGVVVGPRGGAIAHRGGVVVGPRGAAYRGRTAVVGPRGNVAVRRSTVVAGRGGWARPGWYGWPVGGAIAAGAAIGVVSAATAAAWAGPAPAAGMCWYYTDPSRTQGFWDYCR